MINETGGSNTPTETGVIPATTAEQYRHSETLRKINMTWETTQAVISLMVVTTTCIGLFLDFLLTPTVVHGFPPEWWTVLGLVIGFYFGRTNHSRMGDKPTQ